VSLYLEFGNAHEVARRLGCTEGAVRHWRATGWWAELEEAQLEVIGSEARSLLRQRFFEAWRQLGERLEVGDPVERGGSTAFVPVRAKDLAVIGSLALDKLRILEGKPTKIVADSGALLTLMQRFKEVAQQYQQTDTSGQHSQIIDTQPLLPEPAKMSTGEIDSK